MNGGYPGRRLRTLERAFEVIESVRDLDETRVSNIADDLDIAPSTAHGYLSTLTEQRFLVKQGDEHEIGLRFLTLGGYATNEIQGFSYIKQKTKELADSTGERAQFITEEHGLGIYVFTITEDPAVQMDARIGKQRYLHASAAGKAILAHLPDSKLEAVIDKWGLESVTENTITDPDELSTELRQIKEEGYSLNREESVIGLRAVGAPVKDPDGNILGALSVSGPAKRMHGEQFNDTVPRDLLGTVNEIELQIAHS